MSPATAAGTSKPATGQSDRARITHQALLVDAALAALARFRTAQELHRQLRATGTKIGLTTVYRHLRLLAAHAAVDVVRTGTGETAHRTCAGADHHFVCRYCSRTVEITAPEADARLEQVRQPAGVTAVAHTMEITGTCASCAT